MVFRNRGHVVYFGPSLKPYSVVGDPTIMLYEQLDHTIWEGLELVDFAFMPHWHSDHPESKAIERGIEYCKQHGIKYEAIEDGRVLIFYRGSNIRYDPEAEIRINYYEVKIRRR